MNRIGRRRPRGESGGKEVSSRSVSVFAHAYSHVFHFRRIVAFLLLLFALVHARLLGIQDALDLGKLFRLGLVLAHAGGPGSVNPTGRARADADRSATAARATHVGAGKARGTVDFVRRVLRPHPARMTPPTGRRRFSSKGHRRFRVRIRRPHKNDGRAGVFRVFRSFRVSRVARASHVTRP